jgi:hypothetical protein
MGDVSNPHGTPLGLDPLVTPVAQATTVDGVSGGSTDVAVTRSQKRKRDEKEALEVSRHSPVSRVYGVGTGFRRRCGHRRARDPRTRAPSLRRVFPFSVLTAAPNRRSRNCRPLTLDFFRAGQKGIRRHGRGPGKEGESHLRQKHWRQSAPVTTSTT